MQFIWEMGKTMLLFLSFWGYFFLIYRFGKVKIWFVPVICMAGIALILFWSGLLGLLEKTSVLILAGGLGGFAVFLIFLLKGKVEKLHWNMFGILFGAGTIVFGLLSLNLKLIHYDNFSHWALIVKYLLLTGHFPGVDTVMIPFRDYPPSSSLFIYYICRFAGRSQGIMLFAQNSMILACFFGVFGIVKENRRFLLYSFLGAGCASLSYLNLTIRINSLLVDFLLPLLSMASAAVSYRHGDEKRRLCILQIILLGYTGIVKNTGPFFAGSAGIFALGMMIRREKTVKKTVSRPQVFMWGILMSVCAVLPWLAWRYHLNTDLAGFEGKFEYRTTDVQEYGAPVGEKLYGQVTADFLREALSPYSRAAQIFFICTVLSVCAVLYARIHMKKKWQLRWILPAGIVLTVLYYAGMLYMYLFSMPAEEAVRLAGFERYACSVIVLYAGMLIMSTTVDIEHSFAVSIDERGAYRAYSSPGAKRRYQYAVLATMLLGVNFLYSEFNGLVSIREDYADSLPGTVERILGDRWYDEGKLDDKKYLVLASDDKAQVSSGEVRYVCRYFLWAPDVDVVENLSQQQREEAVEEYDCIIELVDWGRSKIQFYYVPN